MNYEKFLNLFKSDLQTNKNIYYHNIYCKNEKIYYIGFHKKDIILDVIIKYLQNFNIKYTLKKTNDIFRLEIKNINKIVIVI